MSIVKFNNFDLCSSLNELFNSLLESYGSEEKNFDHSQFVSKFFYLVDNNLFDDFSQLNCYGVAFMFYFDNRNIEYYMYPLLCLIEKYRENLDYITMYFTKRITLQIGSYNDYFEDSIDVINTILFLFQKETKSSTLAMMYSENIDYCILYLLKTFYMTKNYERLCIDFILDVAQYVNKNADDINYFMSLIYFLDGDFAEEKFLINLAEKFANNDINILSKLYEFKTFSGRVISFNKEEIVDLLKAKGVTFYKNKSCIKKVKCSPYEIIPEFMKTGNCGMFNVKFWNFTYSNESLFENIAEFFKFTIKDCIKLGRLLENEEEEDDDNSTSNESIQYGNSGIPFSQIGTFNPYLTMQMPAQTKMRYIPYLNSESLTFLRCSISDRYKNIRDIILKYSC